TSAPGLLPVSSTADAHLVSSAPTTLPQTKTECIKRYGTIPTGDLRYCEAQLRWFAAVKRCSHRHGGAWRRCLNAVNKAFATTWPKIFAQKRAEQACNLASEAGKDGLTSEDPEYSQKLGQLAATLQACLAKARA